MAASVFNRRRHSRGTLEISFPTPCNSPAPFSPSPVVSRHTACRDRTNGKVRSAMSGGRPRPIHVLEGTTPVMKSPSFDKPSPDVLRRHSAKVQGSAAGDRHRRFSDSPVAGVPSMMFNIGVL